MAKPQISIVIPTYDRHQRLAEALDHLRRQRCSRDDFEVIVVADANEPDPPKVAAAVAAADRSSFRFETAGRPGASAARNAGWRAAKAPLVLFLDDDIMASRTLVEEHLAFHSENSAELTGALGHVRWSRRTRTSAFMKWLDRGIQFDYGSIEGNDAGWGRFYTANVSLKKSMLDRVDGFDEDRLPFGYEDLDLAYRLNQIGFELIYRRTAMAAHRHPMDLEMWKRRVRRIAVAERQFCSLHPDVDPYFFKMFSRASAQPKAKGRAGRLSGFVPPWFPRLGRYVWFSAERRWQQELAPHFLRAWENAADPVHRAEPDLAERNP